MERVKEQAKKFLVSILVFGLLVSIVQPVSVYAYKRTNVTQTQGSELSDALSYEWNAVIEDKKLTVSILDADAGIAELTNSKYVAKLYVAEDGALQLKAGSNFSGTKCNVSYNMSSYEDGIYTVPVYVYAVSGTGISSQFQYMIALYIEIRDGVVEIFSPYGELNVDMLKDLNENYDPKDYASPATYNGLILCKKYDEIVAKAKELTANCSTDLQKIKTIHDWICTNVSYDMEALNSGNTTNRGNASWVFENKLAVCAGFASLGELMFQAVGVPSVYITGRGCDVLDDGIENNLSLADSHAWNAVYCNGSWHYIDMTWDCQNRYYGAGNENNKSDKKPSYRYFGTPAELFGVGHYPIEIAATDKAATHIELESVKKKYFVGEEFSKLYMIYFVTADGTRWYAGAQGLGEATGYDMSKLGTQTVTISYKGFSTSFDINVVDITGIRVEPDTDKVYMAGEDFTPSYKLYYQLSDGTESEVTDLTDVTCTGYDTKKGGTQTVTVSYKNFTTSFDIKVSEIKGIKVVPKVTEYKRGDLLRRNNDIYYIMGDGSEVLIEKPEVTYSGYNRYKIGKQTVTVKCGGYTTTYEVTVTDTTSSGSTSGGTTTTKKPSTGTTTTPTSSNIADITLSADSYTYTGDYIRPVITVKNAAGQEVDKRYYSVIYANNKDVGTGSVTLSFIGTYSGNAKVTKTFTILPKGTKIAKLKPGAKKLNVKIKAQKKQTSGYQIRYALKKNMKGAKMVTLKKNTKLTATIKKLKAKKTYYVQVRTYKTVAGQKYYSDWSKAVSKKTK